MEHHSNLVPWQLLAQKTGAKDCLPSRHRRRRLARFVQARFAAHEAGEDFLDGSHLQFARHGESGRRTLRPRAQARHRHARGRRAERRASAGGRAGHRLRFLCVLRPQDLRADRHRRFVGTAGNSRRHAAVSGRRRNDFVRRLPQDGIQKRAAPVRGRHAGHFRPDWPARRDGLSRRHWPRKHLAARSGTGELRLRKTFRAEKHPAFRPEINSATAPAW